MDEYILEWSSADQTFIESFDHRSSALERAMHLHLDDSVIDAVFTHVRNARVRECTLLIANQNKSPAARQVAEPAKF